MCVGLASRESVRADIEKVKPDCNRAVEIVPTNEIGAVARLSRSRSYPGLSPSCASMIRAGSPKRSHPSRVASKLPTVSEHALQKQVVGLLSRVLKPPVYWTAIDHAGKLSPRQAAARKARGVKRGIADILIMWRDAYTRPHSIWIELKRPGGGSLSKEQKDFDFDMIRCGSHVFVCRSIEEVEDAMALADVPRLMRMAA
jgi:hypothetical protein